MSTLRSGSCWRYGTQNMGNPSQIAFQCRAAIVLGLIGMSVGCDSVTPVRIVNASERGTVISHHDIALDCTLVESQGKPNLTFSENYLSVMPAYPKYGWKYDLTLQVNRVEKGDFEDSVLKLNAAHDIDDLRDKHTHQVPDSSAEQFAATQSQRWTRACVVAFDRGFVGSRTHWTFVRLPDAAVSK